MAEEKYVVWCHPKQAYVAKDIFKTTLDLKEARRFSATDAADFCRKGNTAKDYRRIIFYRALAPECGGNPTFHLPPPGNVFKEVESSKNDPVNHPGHYTSHPSGVECIQVVEHMGFCLGNVVKYIWRADSKGNAVEDLKKARWYIDREIERRAKALKEKDDE